MKQKLHQAMTRRMFIKSTSAAVVFLPYSVSVSHIIEPQPGGKLSTADGLLHFTDAGMVDIYSGVGHMAPYGNTKAINIISDILGLKYDQYKINNGENPAHLPALLGQFSNHLSFATEKTNHMAAMLLAAQLKDKTSDAKNKRVIIVHGQISNDTHEMINKIPGNGIIVAVGEIV